jgi:hypothetical protein
MRDKLSSKDKKKYTARRADVSGAYCTCSRDSFAWRQMGESRADRRTTALEPDIGCKVRAMWHSAGNHSSRAAFQYSSVSPCCIMKLAHPAADSSLPQGRERMLGDG